MIPVLLMWEKAGLHCVASRDFNQSRKAMEGYQEAAFPASYLDFFAVRAFSPWRRFCMPKREWSTCGKRLSRP